MKKIEVQHEFFRLLLTQVTRSGQGAHAFNRFAADVRCLAACPMDRPIYQTLASRNVAILMAAQAFLNALFIIPVMVPYYRDVIGLNFHQFMIAEAVFSATMIVMEVPTGWLSDLWTRRMALVMGALVYTLGWAMLWQAASFPSAMMARGTIGLGVSLVSGTNSALLYESLIETCKEREFRRLEGLRHGIGLYASGASALFGGMLYEWNRAAPIALTVVMSLIATGLLLVVREPLRKKDWPRQHPLGDIAETVGYVMHGHAELGSIIFSGAAILVTAKVMFWAQQPYYALLHVPVAWFGVLTAGGLILGGIGGHFGHTLERRLDYVGVMRICLACLIAVCVASGLCQNTAGLLLLLSGSLISGICTPKLQQALNQRALPERRATIVSMANLMTQILSVPLLAAAGWISEHYGVPASLLSMAALLVIGGVMALPVMSKRF